MKIQDIYTQYKIPINLQNHMYRVAAVGKVVSDLLLDEQIDQELIVSTLLLHDLGNLLKFDLDNTDLLVEQDRERIQELRQIKSEFQQKYGKTPDTATKKMMEELGVQSRVIELFTQSSWESLDSTLEDSNWNRKVCYYSDMRVDPSSVVSLDQRFEDLKIRYSDKKAKVIENHRLAKQLEQQLQSKIDISLDSITEATILPIMKKLHTYEIAVSEDNTR